jgi:precorrin-3B synthase
MPITSNRLISLQPEFASRCPYRKITRNARKPGIASPKFGAYGRSRDGTRMNLETGQRRGFCPSLWTPMESGDGLLVRVRARRGARGILASEVRELARLAHAYGNGLLEVTRRARLQIRGVRAEGLNALQQSIVALGLGAESATLERSESALIVNPWSGLARTCAVLDDVADSITWALAQSAVCDGTSDKLGIVLDSANALAEVAADIHVNVEPDRAGLACVHVAARAQEWSYLGTYRVEDVARVVVELIAALPPGSRMRAMVDDRSVESLRVRAQLAVHRADDLGIDILHTPASRTDSAIDDLGIDTLHTPASRTDSAIDDLGVAAFRGRADLHDSASAARDGRMLSRVGVSSGGASGPVWVELGLPFGSADRTTWEQLALVATRHGSGEIRFTPFRTVLVPGIEREQLAATLQLAEAAGWIADPADPLLRVAACPGAPACSAAAGDTRGLARDLAPLVAAGESLHVSGCAKGCAQSGAANVTLVRQPDGCSLGFDLTTAQTAETARLTLAEARELTAIRSRIARTSLLARDSSTLQARELR